jgi:hypothetical protein
MFAPVGLAADYVGTVDVADTTEMRARTGQGAAAGASPQTTSTGIDAVTEPRVRARLTDRRWEYTLGGALRLTLPDLEQGVELSLAPSVGSTNTPQFFGTGSAGVGWHDRVVRIAAGEDVSYGWYNSGYLVPAAASGQSAGGMPGTLPTILPSAAPQTIKTITSRTASAAAMRLARRDTLTVGASWIVAGGVDAASQAILPQQQGPRADASLSHDLSRTDRVVTQAYAQGASFTSVSCATLGAAAAGSGVVCAPQDEIFQLSEAVQHAFRRLTTLRVSAGLTFARERVTPDRPFDANFYPSGDVLFTHSFGPRGRATLQVGASLAPLVDPNTGLLFNRAAGQAALADTLTRVVTLRAFANALQALPTTDPLATTMVTGGIEVDCLANRQVHVLVGERALWQKEGALGGFFSTVGYLDVTIAAPTLRF